MSATVGGRDDYDASPLHSLVRTNEDLRQARRLLSLACVYDGMSRADVAKGGGMARQSLGDRRHRFNEAGSEGLFDRRVPRPQMRMRPRWLNLLRSSNPAPALSMTLEHDGGVRWRRLDLQRGTEDRFGVVSHERTLSKLPAAPGFPASPGARNTRPRTRAKTRASWRLSKKRPPKPCLPFEPRSGRQADRGPGSGRGPHRPEERPRPHPGVQGDETAMTSRSALQIGLPVRRGLRRQGDRRGPDAAMVLWADTGTRNLPLKEINRTVAKGAQAAVLMDRAPGHTSGEVKGPETLTLIFLPARSPELNRVGNVWQSLRENGLSSRLF